LCCVQEKALGSFNANVFKTQLSGTEMAMSHAVKTGMQGVLAANTQIKKVEASADAKHKTQRTKAIAVTEVEKDMRRDQTAFDETHKQIQAAQSAMNSKAFATLHHHQLENALAFQKGRETVTEKGRETVTDYDRNINWDKMDMSETKRIIANMKVLSAKSADEQKALNHDIDNMLTLEHLTEKQNSARGHEVDQKQGALHRLAIKAQAPHTSAALPNAVAAMQRAAHAAAADSALTQSLSSTRSKSVPKECLDLMVVGGVVKVPKHCTQYAIVQQVIGEAKRRGGVKFAVTTRDSLN